MRRLMISMFLAAGFWGSSLCADAQEKPNPPKEEAKSGIHENTDQLQVRVIYTEYEGEKKVKSFPFALLLSTRNGPPSVVDVGTRIPIAKSAENSASQYEYISVGTEVECRARVISTGVYALYLNFTRSWVEGDVFVPVQKMAGPSSDPSVGKFAQPIIRKFQSDSDINMRDGQTLETIVGTDPVSGRVGKLEVSLTVVK